MLVGVDLLIPLTGDEEGRKELMVPRVRPTPARIPTNTLYTPVQNAHSCILYQVRFMPGRRLVVVGNCEVFIQGPLKNSLWPINKIKIIPAEIDGLGLVVETARQLALV